MTEEYATTFHKDSEVELVRVHYWANFGKSPSDCVRIFVIKQSTPTNRKP